MAFTIPWAPTQTFQPNPRLVDLIRQSGQDAANAQLRQGEIQGQLWGNLGQTIAGIPGTIAKSQQAAIQSTLGQQAVAEGAQKANDLKSLDAAFAQPGSRENILNALPGHLRPIVQKQFADADEAALKVQSAQQAAESATNEYVFQLADTVKAHNYDPAAAQLVLSHAKQTFAGNKSLLDQVSQFEQAIQANPTPDGVKAIIDPVIAARNAIKAKPPEDYSLRQGETRFNTNNKPVASGAPPNPTQIEDDRRYEAIIQRAKLGQSVSPEDKTWAESHEQMKGLTAPQFVTTPQGVFSVSRTGEAGPSATQVPGLTPRPEQEFVTRGGKLIPIPKGTAQPGDVPYTPSQNDTVVQSKLEQQYRQVLEKTVSSRSGGLGLEDQKVNQALHLLSIFDQNRDPKTGDYKIPTVLQTELAMGLARLISPTGVVGEGTVNAINQRTAKGDVAGLLTYLTGTPMTGNTQDVFKMFKDSIERQGHVAQTNRESYLDAMRAMAPTDLEQSRRDQLEQALKLNRMPGPYGLGGPPSGPSPSTTAPTAPAGWKYVPKAGGGWTAVEDK